MTKKRLQWVLLCLIHATMLHAQPGTSAKTAVEYTTFMRLQPGDKVVPLYSCIWLNEKKEFIRLVIQHEGNKYSVITGGERKDGLSLEQMFKYKDATRCDDHDPHKQPKATRYAGSKLVTYDAKGKRTIVSGKKRYGPFEDIYFIQESGEKFIAVAKEIRNGKTQAVYLDAAGRQKVLDAPPLQVITNADLSKAAVIMPPANAVPIELVNKMPKEKQHEYFESLRSQKEIVWFNNDSTGTIAKKYRRLEYDVTGRHFLTVYVGHFFIDGTKINKDVSGAGTRVFAGRHGNSWAYYFQIYLAFSDGTALKDVINPFLTTENGKDYLNWFVVESNRSGDVIKWGKKEL